MRPVIENCNVIMDQVTAGVKTPTLNLPFGILSGDNLQRPSQPGTVPGTVSPRLGNSQAPGLSDQNIPRSGQ
jgi:hypothetical protein